MGCTCNDYVNSCPEIVPVTVNQTIVDLGDYSPREEAFSMDAGTITSLGTVITLGYTPINAAGVHLFRGGSLQRVTVDYTLSGQTITLTQAAAAGELFLAKYLGAES